MIAISNDEVTLDDVRESQSSDFYQVSADFLNETIYTNPYCKWAPNSAPQIAFLSLPTTEALYGGAAGGGKSAALLLAALQYVQTPGYNALLLRRTFADLIKPDALIPLSHQLLAETDAQWIGSSKTWLFPSGASVSFGYCDNENDKYNYQGAQYQFIGFDELTQFSETQYLYLLSRLRKRAGLDIMLRARASANPGGIGHMWVKQRFLDEQNPDRPFIPAKLDDNPDLDKDSYVKSLDLLDPLTRAQLKHGDWDMRPEGNMFKRSWFKTIVDREPKDVYRWHRHWDLAATEPEPGKDPDWVSGVKMGLNLRNDVVIADVRHARSTPKGVEELVRSTANIDGKLCTVSLEEEGGASGKMVVDYYQRVVLLGWAVLGIRPNGDKVTRAMPFSAAVEQGRVILVRGPWINNYLDELCAFPLVEHDDQVDGSSGCYNHICQSPVTQEVMRVSGMERTF